MVSIKGARQFQPTGEYINGVHKDGFTAQQKALKRYLQTENGKEIHAKICKKYQQKPYHCNICNRNLLLGQRARHNRTKIHLSNM